MAVSFSAFEGGARKLLLVYYAREDQSIKLLILHLSRGETFLLGNALIPLFILVV